MTQYIPKSFLIMKLGLISSTLQYKNNGAPYSHVFYTDYQLRDGTRSFSPSLLPGYHVAVSCIFQNKLTTNIRNACVTCASVYVSLWTCITHVVGTEIYTVTLWALVFLMGTKCKSPQWKSFRFRLKAWVKVKLRLGLG